MVIFVGYTGPAEQRMSGGRESTSHIGAELETCPIKLHPFISTFVPDFQTFRRLCSEFSPHFKSIGWYAYMLGLILGIAYSLNSVQYFTSNPSKSRVIISTSVIYICKGH